MSGKDDDSVCGRYAKGFYELKKPHRVPKCHTQAPMAVLDSVTRYFVEVVSDGKLIN